MLISQDLPKARAGFTLIELAVALVIIGVLASIAIVNYNKVRVHAEAAAISHDIHLLEDVLIQAIIAGDIEPGRAPRQLQQLLELLPDNQAVFEPRLPEGMTLEFYGAGGAENYMEINIVGDERHQDVLDALAAMRPTTTLEMGNVVVEVLDFNTLAVRKPTNY